MKPLFGNKTKSIKTVFGAIKMRIRDKNEKLATEIDNLKSH